MSENEGTRRVRRPLGGLVTNKPPAKVCSADLNPSTAPDIAGDLPAPLLTIGDVVAYTRVSEKTIRRAIRDGRLRAFKLPGGLRLRITAVDAWLESCAVQPDPAEQRGGRQRLSEVLG